MVHLKIGLNKKTKQNKKHQNKNKTRNQSRPHRGMKNQKPTRPESFDTKTVLPLPQPRAMTSESAKVLGDDENIAGGE